MRPHPRGLGGTARRRSSHLARCSFFVCPCRLLPWSRVERPNLVRNVNLALGTAAGHQPPPSACPQTSEEAVLTLALPLRRLVLAAVGGKAHPRDGRCRSCTTPQQRRRSAQQRPRAHGRRAHGLLAHRVGDRQRGERGALRRREGRLALHHTRDVDARKHWHLRQCAHLAHRGESRQPRPGHRRRLMAGVASSDGARCDEHVTLPVAPCAELVLDT